MQAEQVQAEQPSTITVAEKFKRYLQRTGLDCKDYQVKGVEWCVEHEIKGYKIQENIIVKGGIIADEMGLGKTIQMLGTIVSNFKMRTLIVLPKALLEQWQTVILKTLGHQPLMYHHFTSKKKLEMIEKLKRSPIVLTTYGMIAINKKKKEENALHHIQWDRVIYDEAHHLRNSSTGEYAGALKIKAQIRWLVTGTPIQNKADDLYSLFNVLQIPRKAYTQSEDGIDVLVSQIILHRTKESIGLILPPLTVETQQVKWETNTEKKTARRYHKDISMCIANADDDDSLLPDEEQLTMFLAMLRSRQTCILSALMEYNQLQYNIQKHIERINSSKTNAVIEKIVERKDNGKKKIIFCHFRGEIDYIKAQLVTTHKIKVAVIDGRTPEGERREILQAKQAQAKQAQAQAQAKQAQAKQAQAQTQEQECEDIQVLILQIQTGCEGLNLQTYSEVYFVSPHWNPAVEDQAVARCHRIGQKEETAVFRFQMDGFDEANNMDQAKKTQSLDEYISSVQLLKREIVKQMLW